MVSLLPSRISLSQMLSSQLLLHSAEQAPSASEAPFFELPFFLHLQGLSASEVSWQKCRSVEIPMELPASPETPRWIRMRVRMRMWMRRAEELLTVFELPSAPETPWRMSRADELPMELPSAPETPWMSRAEELPTIFELPLQSLKI